METRPIYKLENEPEIRPETLRPYSEGWEKPTPDEVRALLKSGGLTGSMAANIIGVNGRTIRKYTGGDISMPYAAWRLLLINVGLVEESEDK